MLDRDIARLCDEISLIRLAEASGVALTKQGKERIGCCPFHEDEATLLVITPENRWRCSGCGASGDVIDWVVKRNGVSRHHAVELLKEGLPEALVAPEPVKTSTVRRLASPVSAQADDQALLEQVVGFYHEALKQSPEGLAFLESKGLIHGELIDRFRLGLANRTLGLRLPEKNRKAGAEIRSRLERIGIYRASGHEHLNGSLIVPIFDAHGRVVQVYGRKIGGNLRAGTPLDLYLRGQMAGVWNADALRAGRGEVILAASLIDAMTFWCAGFRNVTAAYGPEGFTDEHLGAFRAANIKRVLIAFPRNDEGNAGADALAPRLMAEGFACYRIEFPKGYSPNGYALKVPPAPKSLGLLIRKAAWLGQGKAKAPTSSSVEDEPPLAVVEPPEPLPPMPEPTGASPMPAPPIDDPVLSQSEQEIVLLLGDRRYRPELTNGPILSHKWTNHELTLRAGWPSAPI